MYKGNLYCNYVSITYVIITSKKIICLILIIFKTDPNIEELKVSMSHQYKSLYNFLSSSLLQVNDSKTHPMLLTTSQMRRSRNLSLNVTIGAVEQEATQVERLLGLHLHHDLKFREHI